MNSPFSIRVTAVGRIPISERVRLSRRRGAQLRRRTHSNELILRLSEYSFNRADELRDELSMLHNGRWVVDLRNVSYIDSCCLAELIRALKRMRADDARASIDIVNANQLVRMVFAMTCLDTVFHLEAAGA